MTASTILDTHLHLIDRGALSYPWLAGVPALNQDFLLERYPLEAFRCGDRRRAAHGGRCRGRARSKPRRAMSRRSPGGRRARCAARSAPADRRVPIFPPSWSASSPILSSRDFAACCMSFPTRSACPRRFAPMSARLAGTGRPFDLCVRPDQIDKAVALADLCPDVQFVLDHCGAPAIKERAEHPWRESIAEIALRPNVAVKISGVVAYADGESLDRRRHPPLRRACDRLLRLGPSRLGQRLAGLHANRFAFHLGRGDPRDHPRLQRRRTRAAFPRQCAPHLAAGRLRQAQRPAPACRAAPRFPRDLAASPKMTIEFALRGTVSSIKM